jgi:predicted ATPase
LTDNTARFFVVTGGPGSGKSTLIDELERAGYTRSVEAGRGIIQEQVRIGGHALPWGDQRLFAELMLSWEMRSYRMAEQLDGTVFFDRGIVDVAGYLQLVGLPVRDHVHKAAELFRYNSRVFVAPPWREIFHADAERKQDWDEAVRTYEALADAYRSNGYELVQLPCVSVSERVRFVVETAGLPAAV